MTVHSSAHSYTEGAVFEENSTAKNQPHVNFGIIETIKKDSWIKITGEEDLPNVKGSVLCWVFKNGKVQTAIYQCKYFEVKAEYGLYSWDLIPAYQIIEKPEPPKF